MYFLNCSSVGQNNVVKIPTELQGVKTTRGGKGGRQNAAFAHQRNLQMETQLHRLTVAQVIMHHVYCLYPPFYADYTFRE